MESDKSKVEKHRWMSGVHANMEKYTLLAKVIKRDSSFRIDLFLK